MSEAYEAGRKAYQSATTRKEVADHYRGVKPLDKPADWWLGFNDAQDDARWP